MPEIKQESPDDHLTRVRHAIKNFVDSATGPDDRAKRVEYLAGIMRSYQKSEREGYRAQPLPYIAVAAPPRAVPARSLPLSSYVTEAALRDPEILAAAFTLLKLKKSGDPPKRVKIEDDDSKGKFLFKNR